jgi:hypothetical protein
VLIERVGREFSERESPASPPEPIAEATPEVARASTQPSPAADASSPGKILGRRRWHIPAKTVRLRDKEHRRFVAQQPCLVCGRSPADAHHLKFAQPTALGRKVSDEFTVPLCRLHHRELHRHGDETKWWNQLQIDPLPIAGKLWQRGPRADFEAGLVRPD